MARRTAGTGLVHDIDNSLHFLFLGFSVKGMGLRCFLSSIGLGFAWFLYWCLSFSHFFWTLVLACLIMIPRLLDFDMFMYVPLLCLVLMASGFWVETRLYFHYTHSTQHTANTGSHILLFMIILIDA